MGIKVSTEYIDVGAGLRSRWGRTEADGREWHQRGAALIIVRREPTGPRIVCLLRVPFTRKTYTKGAAS